MDELLMESNPYWRTNALLMKSAGLWPAQEKYVKVPIRITVILFILAILIPQMIRGIEEWGKNTLIVIETIGGVFLTVSPIIKYTAAIVAETKLQYLYQQIMKDWKELNEDGEQKILHEVASMGRLLTITYSVYLYTTGTLFILAPGILPVIFDYLSPKNVSRAKTLCIFAEYFIDQQTYYYQLVFLNFLCGIIIVMVYSTVDTAYTCCVQHIVGLFSIVDYHLQKAFAVARNKHRYKFDEAESRIHNSVLQSLEIHNKSIEICDLLQSAFTSSFFFTMGTVLITLSLGTVDVMLNLDNFSNFCRLLTMVMGIVIHMFYVNAPGQKLIDASSNVSYSVYFCGWYTFPLKTQRLLQFMMARSSKRCQFTAGPLLIMNLETCGVILKSAMSYVTFIITVS